MCRGNQRLHDQAQCHQMCSLLTPTGPSAGCLLCRSYTVGVSPVWWAPLPALAYADSLDHQLQPCSAYHAPRLACLLCRELRVWRGARCGGSAAAGAPAVPRVMGARAPLPVGTGRARCKAHPLRHSALLRSKPVSRLHPACDPLGCSVSNRSCAAKHSRLISVCSRAPSLLTLCRH